MYRIQSEFWYVIHLTTAFYLGYLGVILSFAVGYHDVSIVRAIAMTGVGVTFISALGIAMLMFNAQTILRESEYNKLVYAKALNLVVTTGMMTVFVLAK